MLTLSLSSTVTKNCKKNTHKVLHVAAGKWEESVVIESLVEFSRAAKPLLSALALFREESSYCTERSKNFLEL